MTVPTASEISEYISALSRWIDEGNSARPSEAQTWARLAKITEEAGEVVAAYIGATGQNPRKGVTHTMHDVEEELLDVAITALAALEHVRGHDRRAIELMTDKVRRTMQRARIDAADVEPA